MTQALYHKIIDKVIDGKEYQVISKADLILCIKRLGVNLDLEDISIIKNMFPTVVGNLVNVGILVSIMKELSIVEDIPPPSKYLDFSKLTGSSIRIFNKIISYMHENNLQEVDDFIGNDKIENLLVVSQRKEETLQTISADLLGDILISKEIINYKDEIEENLTDFICVGEQYPDIIMIRKFKRALKNIENWKYFSYFGNNRRCEDCNEIGNSFKSKLIRSYSQDDCLQSIKILNDKNGIKFYLINY